MSIKKSIKKKPIAVTACIVVMMITGLCHSWIPCLIVAISLIIGSFCWYEIGSEFAQESKIVRKNRTYVYLGCADRKRTASNPNLERLLLGAMKFKFRVDKHHYGKGEIIDTKCKVGIFKIDVVTEGNDLVIGKEYLGDIFQLGGKPTATLRRVQKN